MRLLGSAEVHQRLRTSNCFSATAAAAILHTYLVETRGDLMLAIGHYHSHTPLLNQRYQVKVVEAATRLFAGRPSQAQPAEQGPTRPTLVMATSAQGPSPAPSEVSAPRKATTKTLSRKIVTLTQYVVASCGQVHLLLRNVSRQSDWQANSGCE